jgi:hypothetical protein
MLDPKPPQIESKGDQILELAGFDHVAVRSRSITVSKIRTLI